MLLDCQAKHTAEGKDFVDNWSVKDFGPKGSKHNTLLLYCDLAFPFVEVALVLLSRLW